MSFFKNLTRAVSLKNLTNVATGNFSAVGKDIVRVVTTKSPAENKAIEEAAKAAAVAKNVPYVPPVVAPVVLPAVVENILTSTGSTFSKNVTSKLANTDVVQNATDFVVTTAVKAYWEKYRNWILGFLAAFLLFFVGRWAFFSGKSNKRARR